MILERLEKTVYDHLQSSAIHAVLRSFISTGKVVRASCLCYAVMRVFALCLPLLLLLYRKIVRSFSSAFPDPTYDVADMIKPFKKRCYLMCVLRLVMAVW